MFTSEMSFDEYASTKWFNCVCKYGLSVNAVKLIYLGVFGPLPRNWKGDDFRQKSLIFKEHVLDVRWETGGDEWL